MPAPSKRPVAVELGGVRYRFTTDAGEAHLRELADLLNERITELNAKTASPAQVLAVVALGLAEELKVVRQQCDELEERADATMKDAIATIDAALAANVRIAEGRRNSSSPPHRE